MLVTIAQAQSDIAGKMKGTSIKQVKDFYGTARAAANRMLGRIDLQETIRIVTSTTPFYDNVNDYAFVNDFKRMIDIRPQARDTRRNVPGRSIFSETTPRQFLTRLDSNSFSIRWNNMVRTLRAQILPQGNTILMDSFDSATANGSWTPTGDISNLQTEVLNYVEGNSSLKMDLSGSTGTGYIENSTATVTDLSAFYYEDTSFLYFFIPSGFSSQFTNFKLRRGSSASAYKEQTVTTQYDGTAFTDGWNFLRFDWSLATTTGSPDNTKNTYRRFTVTTQTGTAIANCIIDYWSNALGKLSEFEYYSENLFRDSTGSTWKNTPTAPTDLINVGPLSYEIFLAEMMIDITQEIRIGAVQTTELDGWRLMLNGQPQTRYVKDPPYHGLYADYSKSFPSSAIVTATKFYNFDV